MIRLCILLSFFSLQVFAQDFSDLELHERPLTGGIEKGIEGLVPGVRANSPYFYYVTVLNRTSIDRNLPTHVIVIGHGGTSGTLFQNAASSHGKKYAEVFPGHQVILITVNELDGDSNAKKLENWGWHVVASRYSMLSVQHMLDEIGSLRKIASLDVYGHSNETSGAALDADFLSPQSDEVRVLASRFLPDAWASVHGCNSGWSLAPALAHMWRIPVSGSFTGTHFQRLHSSGEFWPYDTQLAPPGPFASINPFSYNQEMSCALGTCMRMHPDPYRYWGEWGVATHGLGFYRFACGPVAAAECEKRMALSLLSYVGKVNLHQGSTEAEFLTVLKEYMCPINRDNPVRLACDQGIDAALVSGDDTYTPFLGKSSMCAGDECYEPQDGEVSTAFMDAVKAFLRGYRELSKSNTITRR